MPSERATLLQTRQLSVSIGAVRVCSGLDLALRAGQCWAVLGANGVGKSTLLLSLAGLRPTTSGRILLNGRPINAERKRDLAQTLGLVLQDHSDPLPANVLETALIGRHPHLRAWQWESASDIALAEQALNQLGLSELGRREVQTLSGGERRRLGIATLLTQAPQIMLLDEPTNHLDLKHQIMVLGMLRELAREQGKLVIMSLHDVNLAARFCDHALLLFGEGEVVAGAAATTLNATTLSRLYGYPLRQVDAAGQTHFVPD